MKNSIGEKSYDKNLLNEVFYEDIGVEPSDWWEYVDYLIENLTKEPEKFEVPTEYVDQIVKDGDYMEFADYLDRLEDEKMIKLVMEYIEFNYSDFFEDVKVANNERFYKQQWPSGQGIQKTVRKNIPTKKSFWPPSNRDMTRTNTDLQDVLTW